MKEFLIKIAIAIGIILVYKLILFTIILNTLNSNNSSFYKGYKSNEARVIIVGSSNIGLNYDYSRIKNSLNNFDIVGCGLNEPSGLYATINKLKKLEPTKKDIIVFCLPYSLFDSHKLIPLNNLQKQAFNKTLVKDCFLDFPAETMKSGMVSIKLTGVRDLLNRYGLSSFQTENKISFSAIENSDSLYQSCWSKDDPDLFFINNPSFEIEYFDKISQYIDEEFKSKIFYRYPVLKEELFNINKEKLAYMDKHLKFTNTFESSIFEHDLFFDQFYHLNKCGMELNSSNFIIEMNKIISQLDSKAEE